MAAWLLALAALAAVKAALGAGWLGASLSAGPEGWETVGALRVGSLLLYGSCGLLLLWGARRDRRAAYLGVAYLTIASSSGSSSVAPLADRLGSPLGPLVGYLEHVNPEAFLPLCLWLFFREFPRRPAIGFTRPAVGWAIGLSAAAGAGLFFSDAIAPLSAAWRQIVASYGYILFFWAVLAVLTLPAIVYGLWRGRHASRPEKRRMRTFLAGLALGGGPPLVVFLLAATLPTVADLLRDPADTWRLRVTLRALPLIVPVATAYAVLVEDALDFRLVVRQAIRYALARYTVIAATVVPFAALATYLFVRRQEPVAEVVSQGPSLVLTAAAVAGVAALMFRGGALESIDRKFFREHYDAQRILLELVDRCRRAESVRELAHELRTRIDAALHLESISVVLLDPDSGVLRGRAGTVRDLPASSTLVSVLKARPESLEVDLESSDSAVARMPIEELQYLTDGAWRLLTPLVDSAGELLGFIGLGAKRSELAFSTDDRQLLAGVAAASAMAIEKLISKESSAPGPWAESSAPQPTATGEDLAGACASCDRIFAWSLSRCATCDKELEPLGLPHVLRSKYEFLRRLGEGGMGAVYLARDLMLDRQVAIKTLPTLSPERSQRLRHEARVMASLSHPNLATIYGCETWRGVPLLILEYLEGGTLALRLCGGSLTAGETVELGVVLARALERAHAQGILHRDIKPSNIGFMRDETPKLLDFGLAKLVWGLVQPEDGFEHGGSTTLTFPGRLARTERERPFVGTVAYASPEALRGRRPGPGFDLWGLALALLESVCGSNPFLGSSMRETRSGILAHELPPVRELAPDCPPDLASFLDLALSEDRRQRPSDAAAFRRGLEEIHKTVTGYEIQTLRPSRHDRATE